MMKVKKCPICNQIFPESGMEFCMDCSRKLDDQFTVVRDYLYDNPDASLEEVSEATEVPQKIIIHFLKEGRLQVASSSGLLRCEQCGVNIETGRYCSKCSQKLEERMVQPFLAAMQRQQKLQQQQQAASAKAYERRPHTGD